MGSSEHPEDEPPFEVRNCKLPFELTKALVYELP